MEPGRAIDTPAARDSLDFNLAGEEITVHKNGAAMSMPRVEAALMAIFGKALKGDLPSMKFIAEHTGVDTRDFMERAGSRSIELDEAAVAVLEHHAEWVAIVDEAKAKTGHCSDNSSDEESDDKCHYRSQI